MPKTTPDHHDAELLIKVYDLRRETVLRQSRHAIQREFWPRSWDDVQAVLKPDHPLNMPYRQAGTYWEMVYSFARHGIVHPGFWLENNAEGLFLYVKMEPYLAKLREAGQPTAFRNAEWVAKECPETQPVYARIKARVAQLAAARQRYRRRAPLRAGVVRRAAHAARAKGFSSSATGPGSAAAASRGRRPRD